MELGNRLGIEEEQDFHFSETNEEKAANLLEHFAMGKSIGEQLEHRFPLDHQFPAGHSISLLVDPNTNVILRLLRALPSLSQSRALIQFYFEQLQWYSKVIHAPSFMLEADGLQTAIAAGTLDQIHVPFLGTYCMVLCLSLHLMDISLSHRIGLDVSSARSYAKHLYSVAQVCLQYHTFLGSHCLEYLQCIILMGLYQQNCGQSGSQWALLGASIKIAQNMGLSRLGSETERRVYPQAWSSVVKREIGRRVWWTLVYDDWAQSAAHHGTYSIHPGQNRTGYPLNINDADLVEGAPVTPKPSNQYTEMTSFLCRLQIIDIYRQNIDNYSSSGYGYVLEIDTKLTRSVSDLPQKFTLPTSASSTYLEYMKSTDMTLCLILGEAYKLKIHRPFLFKAYRDKRYLKSREQCTNSARSILHYLRSQEAQTSPLVRCWPVLLHGFNAAIVLFIDLCYSTRYSAAERNQQRLELQKVLELFTNVQQSSPAAGKAVKILEKLLDSEPAPSSPTNRKRASPDDDTTFEHVVKRLVIDASTGTSSPITGTLNFSTPTTPDSHSSPLGSYFGTPMPHQYSDTSLSSDPIHLDEKTMIELSQLFVNQPTPFSPYEMHATAINVL
ncbi:hypothetical protein BDQ17DRAFT_1283140 [Cyathus striatus]|nr:hypothetical protein BDQ17DRAFT_1283140 [Cyathus striatus]